eukprot:gene4783-872_t
MALATALAHLLAAVAARAAPTPTVSVHDQLVNTVDEAYVRLIPHRAAAVFDVTQSGLTPTGHSVQGCASATARSVAMDNHPADTKCSDGTACWGNGTLNGADLAQPKLRSALSHLAPAWLRLGGHASPAHDLSSNRTLGWLALMMAILYTLPYVLVMVPLRQHQLSEPEPLGRAPHHQPATHPALGTHLPGTCRDTGLSIAFNLNYPGHVDRATGEWNSSNAEAYRQLASVVRVLYPHGPLPAITGADDASKPAFDDPARPFSVQNITDELGPAGGAVTHYNYHHYMGVSEDRTLAQRVLSPEFLGPPVQPVLRGFAAATAKYGADLWVGEGALAAHSGQDGLCNTFTGTLWWLDRLAQLAYNNHTVWAHKGQPTTSLPLRVLRTC